MWPDCTAPRAAPLEGSRRRPVFCEPHAVRGHRERRRAAGLALDAVGADLFDPKRERADAPKALAQAVVPRARRLARRRAAGVEPPGRAASASAPPPAPAPPPARETPPAPARTAALAHPMPGALKRALLATGARW